MTKYNIKAYVYIRYTCSCRSYRAILYTSYQFLHPTLLLLRFMLALLSTPFLWSMHAILILTTTPTPTSTPTPTPTSHKALWSHRYNEHLRFVAYRLDRRILLTKVLLLVAARKFWLIYYYLIIWYSTKSGKTDDEVKWDDQSLSQLVR